MKIKTITTNENGNIIAINGRPCDMQRQALECIAEGDWDTALEITELEKEILRVWG